MVTYDHLEYSVTDGRAEIIFDRPEVLNAFTDATIDELNDALYRAHEDGSVYIILLSGKGRGFCSGADVRNMDDDDQSRLEGNVHLWKVQNVSRLLYKGAKPTIAAINGPAIGAGCGFALACDLRVISENAVLREQFVNIGLVPGDGDGYLLPELIGESKAKEYMLTGKDITPEEAEETGLVVDIVPEGEALQSGREIANVVRDKPATAVQKTKELINEAESFEEYADAATDAQWAAISDPEHSEAVAALLDGRDPDYEREY